MTKKKKTYYFAMEFQKLSIAGNIRDTEIVRRFANYGKRVSPAYIGQLRNGVKHPSIDNIEMLARALFADGDAKRQLHIAAARDAGYEI